jgi:preprotein translocase subunit SecF
VFQLIKEPKIDFMSRRRLPLMLSTLLVVASIVVIAVVGINRGIEFSGGTELQLKFAETPDVGEIRAALRAAGLDDKAVSTIGDPDENEIYIRLSVREDLAEGEEEEDRTAEIREALRAQLFPDLGNKPDLNVSDKGSLARLFETADDLGGAEAATLAEAISGLRRQIAIFHSWDEIAEIPEMTPQALQFLQRETVLGPVALRGQSYIGPAVGRELMAQARVAIIFALVLMMIYIWIRFQLQWGLAAVAALTHDTLITLGLFVVLGQEMSLPVVAAFLTLVGYSVNDTVVVFDRIRENLGTRQLDSLEALINLSINQTLGRTIITSGSTWLVVTGLYIFGGAALRPFAFVLTVGILVGTYSSIFVASPILVLWKQYLAKREMSPRGGSKSTRKVKKVRRTSAG